MSGQNTILDCLLHKLPSSRKYYRVTLIVPDNGIPIIEYHQAGNTKKPKKVIEFVDLLFADKKHDHGSDKFAFSVYTTTKTITFLAKDETTMNEWLTKIREHHSNLYPEFKRYDYVFEADLLDKGLARTLNIHGPYRLALCKESLDLMPLITPSISLATNNITATTTSSSTSTTTTTTAAGGTTNTSSYTHHQLQPQQPIAPTTNETLLPKALNVTKQNHTSEMNIVSPNTSFLPHHVNQYPQHLPRSQRFNRRHPLLSSKTIELVLRSIRRCGHTDCNFYIESGRHSQIGEGDLWMHLTKKSTARQLHELLLAAMKNASSAEDQFLYKAPRSRSGSSSDNAHRSHRSRSSSLVCLAADLVTNYTSSNVSNNNNNNNNIDEDSGYLPMA